MAIQQATITLTGTNYLLLNNPQTADPFNNFAKKMKGITKKKIKTDDDLIELGNIEVESKLYYDDELKVYVPSRWLTEQIITKAHSILKKSREEMRGGVFAVEDKCKLSYDGMDKVQTIADVVMNPKFVHRKILPQGKVRVCKNFPIFKDWSFTVRLEFDDTVIDFSSLKRLIERTAKYNGFGDFRPTFGTATAEVKNV
jgi:hypothetical protein